MDAASSQAGTGATNGLKSSTPGTGPSSPCAADASGRASASDALTVAEWFEDWRNPFALGCLICFATLVCAYGISTPCRPVECHWVGRWVQPGGWAIVAHEEARWHHRILMTTPSLSRLLLWPGGPWPRTKLAITTRKLY